MRFPTAATAAPTKPTVICLHSSGGTGGQWAALRALLEPDANVVTPDLIGHGAGPGWHGRDADIVASDAARITCLAEAAPARVHLVGHSYGAAVALRVALHHPERVASVAVYEPVAFRLLFDCEGLERTSAEVVAVAEAMRRRLDAGAATAAAEGFVDYWGGPGAWQRLPAPQQAAIAGRMRVVVGHFAGLAHDVPRLGDYASLRAPVLVLAGSRTRAPVRWITALLRTVLPNAAFETLPGLGHMGPLTHASMVAQRIADFVRGSARLTGSGAPRLAA